MGVKTLDKQDYPIYFEFKPILDLIEETIDDIEKGVISSGDVVYCSRILQDIIFLEGPSVEMFENYHKEKLIHGSAPFLGDIKYKTKDGKVGECPIACITKISSGKYFSTYNVLTKRDNHKIIVENLEYLARANGFRVERIKKRGSFLLKIFGDSQEEVDRFISYIKDYRIVVS